MKKLILALVAVFGVVFATSNLQAQCNKMGEGKSCCAKAKASDCKDIKVLSKAQLEKMIKNGSVVVVDARNSAQYKEGHIDGALNYGVDPLPTDKSKAIVFYCGGPKCPLSTQVAKEVKEKGYTKVMVFKGGWSGWSKKA